MVQGRVIYETMEEYWPRARDDASLPDVMREYGEIWTAKPKVLVSRTRRTADHNTRIIVYASDGTAARYVAGAIASEGFQNVNYLEGSFAQTKAAGDSAPK